MKLTTMPPVAPTMVRDIDEVFDRFFNPPFTFPAFGFRPLTAAVAGTWTPAVDLTETEKEFILRAEVPGVPRENLDVHLEGEVLILTGHREQKLIDVQENVLWEEREVGKFIRTLRLPKAVEATKVEAVYTDGVLTVRLPKKVVAAANKILIKG